MDNEFFERPILNSPYDCPARHWELDPDGQPTQQIIERRRQPSSSRPFPSPGSGGGRRSRPSWFSTKARAFSTEKQQYDPTPIINELRHHVDQWRKLPNPNDWQVTPETARLLQHWRQHKFNDIRPFFCQIEAVETAIWLTEVAPKFGQDGQGLSWNTSPTPTTTPIRS